LSCGTGSPSTMRSRLASLGLRDVFILSLPVLAVVAYVHVSVLRDFYNLCVKLDQPFPNLSNTETFSLLYERKFRTLRAALTRKAPPAESSLPTIEMLVNRDLIRELGRDLPASGKEYKEGWMMLDGRFRPVKVRYRGDYYYHWFCEKKSWRVKTRKSSLFRGRRLLNFIAPKFNGMLHDDLAYALAHRMDLLAPHAEWVRLFLNRAYQGVYLYVDQIDESWLRLQDRLPGNIYSGEDVASAKRKGVRSSLLENPYIWDVVARDSRLPPDDRSDLQELINALWLEDPRALYGDLERILDIDATVRFAAYASLTNSHHFDRHHNLKLYLDPSKGLFEPIVWDAAAWNPGWMKYSAEIGPDIASNELFVQIMRNPLLVERKNRIVAKMLENGVQSFILQRAESTYAAMQADLDADAFRGFGLMGTPLTMSELREEVAQLQQWIAQRCNDLEECVSDASLKASLVSVGPSVHLLRLVCDGTAGTRVDSLLCADTGDGARVRIYRDVNFTGSLDDADSLIATRQTVRGALFFDDTLYPGRRFEQATQRVSHLVAKPAPLQYPYLLVGPERLRLRGVVATNTLTDDLSTVEVGRLPALGPTDSFHPWHLLERPRRDTIVLSGTVHLKTDLHVAQRETLVVKPGTLIKLDPEVSILCEGRLTAEGSEEATIRFRRADAARPWGVIALQGHGADRSSFTYCSFVGGSLTSWRHMQYSGMVSVRHARKIRFENCHFEENLFGDDTFHAIHSEVTLDACSFADAYGDAIDFDLSTGSIRHCRFENVTNDAIDLMTSPAVIAHNMISGAGDKGISVGEASHPLVFNNLIIGNTIGIEIKDTSDPLIVNNAVIGNGTGINLYKKNWRYGGGGRGEVFNTVIARNRTDDIRADDDSHLILAHSLARLPESGDSTKIAATEVEACRKTEGQLKSANYRVLQAGMGSADALERVRAGVSVFVREPVPVGLYQPERIPGLISGS
jgi:parallel beta-helix repeat protein